MDKNQKAKSQKLRTMNVLESLKDIGAATTDSIKEDLIKKAPQDFMDHLFGPRPQENFSGELYAGESLEITDVYTGQHEEKVRLEKQIASESG